MKSMTEVVFNIFKQYPDVKEEYEHLTRKETS
jgi:hypothetical protein